MKRRLNPGGPDPKATTWTVAQSVMWTVEHVGKLLGEDKRREQMQQKEPKKGW